MSVTLTEFAQDTLVAAYDFVYDSSPQNADLVLERVEEILELLKDRKFIGENGPIPEARRYLIPRTSLFVVYRVVIQLLIRVWNIFMCILVDVYSRPRSSVYEEYPSFSRLCKCDLRCVCVCVQRARRAERGAGAELGYGRPAAYLLV